MPRFFAYLLSIWLLLDAPAMAAGDVVTLSLIGSDYPAAREALVEAIEAEGLVVGVVLPFSQMLHRTGGDGETTPFREAEIFQFCSSALARQMVLEAAPQLAMCPLSIALYSEAHGAAVVLAYRSPGEETPARRLASALLLRLVKRAGELARMRW